MLATQLSPACLSSLPTNVRGQRRDTNRPAVTSNEVKNMLLEIAFTLHATRAVKKVRRADNAKTPVVEV